MSTDPLFPVPAADGSLPGSPASSEPGTNGTVERYRHAVHVPEPLIGVDFTRIWLYHVVPSPDWGRVPALGAVVGTDRRLDLEDFVVDTPTVSTTFRAAITDPPPLGGHEPEWDGWQIGIRFDHVRADPSLVIFAVTHTTAVDLRWWTASPETMLSWRHSNITRVLIGPNIPVESIDRCRPVTVKTGAVYPNGPWTPPRPWTFRDT